MNKQINAVYREPFELGSPQQMLFAPGTNVANIVNRMNFLPPDFKTTGRVFIDNTEVPRALWSAVKPKAGVVVTFHGLVQGGGDGGGKSTFALIAALALTVFTAGVAGGLLAPVLGSSFAAGTFGASALAAGISLVGSLAINAITAPPTNRAAPEAITGTTLEATSVSGNVLEANSPIPRVIGTRRIYPPFAFEPVIEMVGQNQIVEAAYCLAGPHKLTDIQLGGVSVDTEDDDTDLTIETREGLPGDGQLSLTRRQGRTSDLSLEMSKQGVSEENNANWDGSTLPLWHGFNGKTNPDEIWLHLQLNGLYKGDDEDAKLRIPLRIRMKRRGETSWRYLPEIHYQEASQNQIRMQVKFYFGGAAPGGLPQPATDRGFVEARKLVPAQDVEPYGEEWVADDYFSAGSGSDVYRSGTQNSTNVQNMFLTSANKVEVFLDEAEWPDGIYDIEVKRGAVFRKDQYDSDAYTYGGEVLDFFGGRNSRGLPLTTDQLIDGLYMLRGVSIWNDYPINQSGLSLISLKATNREVSQLSVLASGYVRDFGGYVVPVASAAEETPDATITGGTYDGTLDAAFECSVVLPAIPSEGAVLFELGNASNSASLRVSDGYLILRAGDPDSAVAETNADTVVAKIAITSLPFDGEVHKIAWDFRVSPGRCRLWIDDVFIVEENTTGGGNLSNDNWCGTGNGGYLTYSGAVAGEDAPADWDDLTDASNLSIWEDALHDVSGEGWNVVTKTSNPVPHYRDVSAGTLNFDPLPHSLLDDEKLLEWRDACYRGDFTCDYVAEGERVQDLREIMASCGFARPYQSELWGVVRDYDRSAENPVQIFSPRNSRELNWKKAFPNLPSGFRVNFKDATDEDADTQITVYRPGSEGNATRLEQVSYQGITREAKAIERALFDLAQGRLRSVIYSMVTPIESIVCRRGSLVGVNHDILLSQHGSARIYSIGLNGGNVETLTLDSDVQVYNEIDMLSVTDVLAVDDMHEVGLQTAVAIRQTDGTFTVHPVSNSTGETDELTLTTPVANDTTDGGPFDDVTIPLIDEGCLIVVGNLGKEYKRLIVTEIAPQNEHIAALTMVDEAPELWS